MGSTTRRMSLSGGLHRERGRHRAWAVWYGGQRLGFVQVGGRLGDCIRAVRLNGHGAEVFPCSGFTEAVRLLRGI